MITKELSKLPALRLSFIEPMYARVVSELREGNLWSYEAKLDGYRCLGGYTAGNPFDALIVGCYDGAVLNFVAKVRNGFVPQVRR